MEVELPDKLLVVFIHDILLVLDFISHQIIIGDLSLAMRKVPG
jgi:hypothetical protein